MNLNDMFPGSLLKASDVKDDPLVYTIKGVEMGKLGEDTKPIISFAETDLGLALNKTNATTIADSYGPETDAWVGKKIQLYCAQVDFQGRRVDAIRVRGPKAASPPPPAEWGDTDSDMPF